MRQARLSAEAPTSERERDAARRLGVALPGAPPAALADLDDREQACSWRWGLLFPGLTQLCHGQSGDAAALLTLGTLEAGLMAWGGVAAGAGFGADLRFLVPALAFSDLWAYGLFDGLLDQQRAERRLYVPQDTLAELAAAPFNPTVLGRLEVWLGLAGLSAAALGYGLALADPRPRSLARSVELLGHELDAGVGYPLATAAGAAVFTHVAIAEEAIFRGYVQSGLARSSGTWPGYLWSTLLFGALHAPNALLLPEGQRLRYLLYDLPFVTAVGAYLGLAYHWGDYSLTGPVAIHFWYDLLVTLASFALTGEAFPFSAAVVVGW